MTQQSDRVEFAPLVRRRRVGDDAEPESRRERAERGFGVREGGPRGVSEPFVSGEPVGRLAVGDTAGRKAPDVCEDRLVLACRCPVNVDSPARNRAYSSSVIFCQTATASAGEGNSSSSLSAARCLSTPARSEAE